MTAKFSNGDLVKDTVTGYQGMVVGTILWLNGCYRYIIQAQRLQKTGDDEGKPVGEIQVDENQLRLVKASKVVSKHDTGGPDRNVSPRMLKR